MVQHKCYFCNYNTIYLTNFKNHIKKKKKCSYLINGLEINDLETYNKYVDLHKIQPDNEIWGSRNVITTEGKFKCLYCHNEYTRNENLKKHLTKCKRKQMLDLKTNIDSVTEDISENYNNFFEEFCIQIKNEQDKKKKDEEERKHKCEYCDKKFKRKYHLTRHLNTCKKKNLIGFNDKYSKMTSMEDLSHLLESSNITYSKI